MLTSDQINHIKIIKYSGIFGDYRKEYSEYTDLLKTYDNFAKNYMPLRNMVSNYYDDKILEKMVLYEKFVKKNLAFRLIYVMK